MPTPNPFRSRTFLCLLGLSLSAPGAFAQGPALSREAVRASALRILGEAFPGQLRSFDVPAAPASVAGHRTFALASDPNAKDDDGTTALMRAAKEGQTDAIRLILAQPGVRVDEKDPLGQTAVMLAAIRGRTEAVRLLLEAKADPKTINDQGETALMFAAMFGYTKTAQVLLEGGSEVNARDAKGNTPLILSVTGGRLSTVVLLASASGVLQDAKNAAGTTALLEAARHNEDAEILAALIDHGADKDLAGDYQEYGGQVLQDYTPLMAAAASNNLPGVKALVDRKANLDYRDRVNGKTALGLAKAGYHQDMIDFLTAAGAHE